MAGNPRGLPYRDGILESPVSGSKSATGNIAERHHGTMSGEGGTRYRGPQIAVPRKVLKDGPRRLRDVRSRAGTSRSGRASGASCGWYKLGSWGHTGSWYCVKNNRTTASVSALSFPQPLSVSRRGTRKRILASSSAKGKAFILLRRAPPPRFPEIYPS